MRTRLLLAVLALAASPLALAGDISVRWEIATEYEDGSPLPAEEIQAHRIEWSKCASDGTFGDKLGETVAAMPSQEVLIARLTAGTYCVRGFTIATNGEESVASDVASKRIKGRPNKPVVVIL